MVYYPHHIKRILGYNITKQKNYAKIFQQEAAGEWQWQMKTMNPSKYLTKPTTVDKCPADEIEATAILFTCLKF